MEPDNTSHYEKAKLVVGVSSGDGKPKLKNTVRAVRKALKAITTDAGHKSCFACQDDIIPGENYISALGKKYHITCFRCHGCHEIISPSDRFASYTKYPSGIKHPIHFFCRGNNNKSPKMECTVCDNQCVKDYIKHPIFADEQICQIHNPREVKRCTSCRRFEPRKKKTNDESSFVDLGFRRRLCPACHRTAVVDCGDATNIWRLVLGFLEETLKIKVWKDMKHVPIMLVPSDVLIENISNTSAIYHNSLSSLSTCIMGNQSGRLLKMSNGIWDPARRSFKNTEILDNTQKNQVEMSTTNTTTNMMGISPTTDSDNFTYFAVPDKHSYGVTAVLCLSGLPRELTAALLCHEAMHVWFRKHPIFGNKEWRECGMPREVEEGCCLLVRREFLKRGGLKGKCDNDLLTRHFIHEFTVGGDEVTNGGLTIADRLSKKFGIEELLSEVVIDKCFPKE